MFQQGVGLVDAYRAVHPTTTGHANRDAQGYYYLEGLDGFMWNDGFMWSDTLSEPTSTNVWVGQQ
ncbi:MAG: hypothetical protein VYE68_04770 [Acidobacteriota bacterium]|nr:hypothetical protein [Acidobacteriota bacterium]